MTDQNSTQRETEAGWQGFREVDRAIAENRLTSYTWRKTWTDPWGRAKLILIGVALFAFAIFVMVDELVV